MIEVLVALAIEGKEETEEKSKISKGVFLFKFWWDSSRNMIHVIINLI